MGRCERRRGEERRGERRGARRGEKKREDSNRGLELRVDEAAGNMCQAMPWPGSAARWPPPRAGTVARTRCCLCVAP
jgi:hypothetical protein